jgi:RimJ/RimL family protein N-acetyltransferase
MVRWLESTGVGTITAHVHADHRASARVAARAGLEPTGDIEGGEVVWRRTLARAT